MIEDFGSTIAREGDSAVIRSPVSQHVELVKVGDLIQSVPAAQRKGRPESEDERKTSKLAQMQMLM